MTSDKLVVTFGRGGDLARRVIHRREQLGLTQDEVARRAGMAGGYIEYLEHSPAVELSSSAMLRLAVALETTVAVLSGGNVDRAPGTGRAAPHARLESLSRTRCEAHLTAGGVGRFVFVSESGPIALPVNYAVFQGDVVFRTRSAASRAAVGTKVSFEIDHVDEAMSEGWSVLVSGTAHHVDDPWELEQLRCLAIDPWPGHRGAFIRIETATISGRIIRHGLAS